MVGLGHAKADARDAVHAPDTGGAVDVRRGQHPRPIAAEPGIRHRRILAEGGDGAAGIEAPEAGGAVLGGGQDERLGVGVAVGRGEADLLHREFVLAQQLGRIRVIRVPSHHLTVVVAGDQVAPVVGEAEVEHGAGVDLDRLGPVVDLLEARDQGPVATVDPHLAVGAGQCDAPTAWD